jgi:2,4-dienoyl-CoA reductase-like NADH-dependent reductase (Old Yellow Enzyme family)
MNFPRMASFKSARALAAHLQDRGIPLELDDEVTPGPDGPLAHPLTLPGGLTLGNRFAIQPMEGWDGTPQGAPSEYTVRRWQRFGASGAKLIWGGEAVAVRHDGRANPNQLRIGADTLPALAALREALVQSHAERYGQTDDLLIGLQLTHSGRFCRPNDKKRLEPWILYHHPILDRKFGTPPDYPVMTDAQIRQLIEDYVVAGRLAQAAGFAFVDIKHCHSYLGHEFLSAYDRSGPYGGSFENRTRFLREIVQGIRADAPGLTIGVRLSAFDFLPFRPGPDRTGEPEPCELPYRHAFGGDGTGVGIDLTEPKRFLDLLATLNIPLVNLSCASPYYNPHLMRPAMFPPSDGYQPPEDPLLGVARQINVAAELKAHRPELVYVGSGYTYLQEWLPHVAQHAVRTGRVDLVGLGRMVLAYPELPADALAGRRLERKKVCRTFSDCTTGPRNGLISGCYPLDDYYKRLPEAETLEAVKAALKAG